MVKRLYVFAVSTVLFTGIAAAQEYPLMNAVADRVIQKYQSASCEQLWKRKGKPKSAEEKNVIQLLQGDPQMRAAFINKIAGPVVNKMFDCGLIP